MYAIRYFCPRTDVQMGTHGFAIDLPADWPELVRRSGLNQEKVNQHIASCGRRWLDATGHNGMFDPDNCGFQADKSLPPGPNARPTYSHREIQVIWGEWGAEHISVPGNACGLDITRDCCGFGSIFLGGRQLQPHNIDSWHQKNLLTIVFTELAESVLLFSRTNRD